MRARALSLAAVARLVEGPGRGAVVSFSGVVRGSENGRPIRAIRYESYRGMAEDALAAIEREARRRWNARTVLLHRVGRVPVGEASLVVACAARHRREAFEACRWAVEQVKKRVTVWKTEFEWT